MRKGGTYYRDVWLPETGKQRKCLRTFDRAEAERLARAFLAERLRGGIDSLRPECAHTRRTLGSLSNRVTGVPRQCTEQSQRRRDARANTHRVLWRRLRCPYALGRRPSGVYGGAPCR